MTYLFTNNSSNSEHFKYQPLPNNNKLLPFQLVPRDPNTPHLPEKSTSLSSSSLLAQRSPKLIGVPRPYTPKVYSSGSYMANRPSYMGSYRRPEISSDAKPTFSVYTKLPGLRNDPLDMEPVAAYTPAPVGNSTAGGACNNVDFVVKETTGKEGEGSAHAKTNCVNHVNSSGETEVSGGGNINRDWFGEFGLI